MTSKSKFIGYCEDVRDDFVVFYGKDQAFGFGPSCQEAVYDWDKSVPFNIKGDINAI